jgi:hypothetical protein
VPPRGWKIVSLREEVWREVKEFVEKKKIDSTTSISAFVNDAVKEKLKKEGRKDK